MNWQSKHLFCLLCQFSGAFVYLYRSCRSITGNDPTMCISHSDIGFVITPSFCRCSMPKSWSERFSVFVTFWIFIVAVLYCILEIRVNLTRVISHADLTDSGIEFCVILNLIRYNLVREPCHVWKIIKIKFQSILNTIFDRECKRIVLQVTKLWRILLGLLGSFW